MNVSRGIHTKVGTAAFFAYQGVKIVKCQNCKMVYRQKQEPQMIGHRFREDDVCPYCKHSNGSSMEHEYKNRK